MTNEPKPQTTLDVLDGRRNLSIDLGRWRKALVITGMSEAEAEQRFAKPDDIAKYFADEPHYRLLEALQVVGDLGTRRGREAVGEVRRAADLMHLPVTDADYLDLQVHAFPSQVSAKAKWQQH